MDILDNPPPPKWLFSGAIGYLYDPGGGDPPFQPMAGCNQARLAKSEGERLMAQASVGWLRKINA